MLINAGVENSIILYIICKCILILILFMILISGILFLQYFYLCILQLSKSENFEERKKIRARMKEIREKKQSMICIQFYWKWLIPDNMYHIQMWRLKSNGVGWRLHNLKI